ncbi:MAG: serine/threonine protein kinase [Deltaproteobacteria bacterium]|nr:serine/threonine protein kinase [Deltaproteobacteria bacterium]
MPASVQSPPTVRQFGKYILDEEIARGGMARVYLARLRGLGGFEKKLVVKQVLPELATDPRFIEMFVEEAKTLVQMSHPHIVPVYELGIVDGVYFLAMEFVDGATLAEILGEGPLPPTLAAHLGMQVCDALSYSHERFELVHRDVTPRNVIVDSLGHVRLLDFGIAARPEGTLVGEVFGSHGYMSPEQARGAIVSPQSDLFSLGTVLYEALINRPAFLRGSPEQTRAALLDEPPPSLADHGSIPPVLARLVDETLMPGPEDRPVSAKRMGKMLRAFLAASAPEGVAPELGDRARSAKSAANKRHRKPADPSASLEGDTPARASVRTIATSVTLRRILGDESTDSSDAVAPAPTLEEGTVPIPGRTSSQDGTVPIPERSSNQGATLPFVRESPAERKDSPTRNRRPLLVAGLVVVVVAALGYRAAMDRGSGQEGRMNQDAGADRSLTDAATALAAGATEDAATPTDGGPADAASPSAQDAHAASSHDSGAGPSPEGPVNVIATSARISISAQPWGEYRLDRAALGTEAVRDRAIAPGRHTLRITNDSLGKSAEVTFEAEAGEALRALVNFNDGEPTIQITRRRGS